MTGEPLIREDWLAEVGFKYRGPGRRQPFRHWNLYFDQSGDDGLHIETTMMGSLTPKGEHVNFGDRWHVWIGRNHSFFHLRHMKFQWEMELLVQGLSGHPWMKTATGRVEIKDKP